MKPILMITAIETVFDKYSFQVNLETIASFLHKNLYDICCLIFSFIQKKKKSLNGTFSLTNENPNKKEII